MAIELQNRVSLATQLSKPSDFGHQMVLAGGFADVASTWLWGPHVGCHSLHLAPSSFPRAAATPRPPAPASPPLRLVASLSFPSLSHSLASCPKRESSSSARHGRQGHCPQAPPPPTSPLPAGMRIMPAPPHSPSSPLLWASLSRSLAAARHEGAAAVESSASRSVTPPPPQSRAHQLRSAPPPSPPSHIPVSIRSKRRIHHRHLHHAAARPAWAGVRPPRPARAWVSQQGELGRRRELGRRAGGSEAAGLAWAPGERGCRRGLGLGAGRTGARPEAAVTGACCPG